MVKHPDRQKHVRELNNAAKACGLQGIRDDVGRQAVLDFIQRVRQSAGPEPFDQSCRPNVFHSAINTENQISSEFLACQNLTG